MVNQARLYNHNSLLFIYWPRNKALSEEVTLWLNGALKNTPLIVCPINKTNNQYSYLLVTSISQELNSTSINCCIKNKKLKDILRLEKSHIFPVTSLSRVIFSSNLNTNIRILLKKLPQFFPELSAKTLFKVKQHLQVEQFRYSKSSYEWQLQLLFDENFYLAQHSRENFPIEDPLKHYLEIGGFKNYNPNPLFHSSFYLTNHPGVKHAGINPLVHYIQHGHFDGFNPNPLFKTDYYLKKYPEVNENNYNPLIHYLYIGAFSNFKPDPLFDSEYYLKHSPELIKSDINPLYDYFKHSKSASKKPNPYFDNHIYIKQAIETDFNTIPPLQHYYEFGCKNGLETSKKIDEKSYLRINKDVRKNKINPLVHFIEYGLREGRSPIPEEKFKRLKVSKLIPLLKKTSFFSHQLKDSVDIIIPVFNQLRAVKRLFQSLFKNTTSKFQLIIINDASNDKVREYLNQLKSRHSNITLIHNPKNLGYVKSCNIGFSLAKHNIVLLNTDVTLPSLWLERLMSPIEKDPQIASVTPFSNSATLCSFPLMPNDNPMYLGLSVDEIDSEFRQLRVSNVNLPTAVGFCMSVNKAVLDKVGPFNEELFEKGYGEENDWSQRAILLGYKHILATNLFVEHKHGLSFSKKEKKKLLLNSEIRLKELWPDYFSQVNQAILEDPSFYHKLLARLLLLCRQSNRVQLIIDHNLGGGTTAYRKHLTKHLIQKNHTVIIVYPIKLNQNRYQISVLNKKDKVRVLVRKFSKVIELLLILNIKKIQINSLVGYPDLGNTFKLLKNLKKVSGSPLKVLIHDYYPLCPSYNLIDYNHKFCRLPPLNRCQNCYSKLKLATKSEDRIHSWRKQWMSFLTEADKILTFSFSSEEIFTEIYPDFKEKVVVKPHSMNYFKHQKIILEPPNGKLKIGVLGNINVSKGLNKLISLANYRLKSKTNHEIHIIGNVSDPKNLPNNLSFTGSYTIEHLPQIIKEKRLNVFFMPSIWPETFSYVTEELILLDVPIVAYDLGAQGTKIRDYPKGKLIPLNAPNSEILKALYFK